MFGGFISWKIIKKQQKLEKKVEKTAKIKEKSEKIVGIFWEVW